MALKEEKLNLTLKKIKKIVNPTIKEILSSYIDRKNKGLVNYQISTGGKRIRPAFAIISCWMLGGKTKDVLYPAAGLEILHNYTLIVDDIIDHSELRRKKQTTWAKFGKSMAQCAGIDYSAAIFQAANMSKSPTNVSELFAKAIKTIMEGEILDILFEQKGRDDEPYIVKNRYRKITENDYLKMIAKKTASLLQTSCEVGGICAGAKKQEIDALKNYGFNLGIAFQIQDDILDIFGDKKFGKKIGKDILERKRGNIVILHALKELRENDKKHFLRIIKRKKIRAEDVKRAIRLIKKTQARKNAEQLEKKYVSKAKYALFCLPQNQYNQILRLAADFVIKRKT